MCSTSRIAGTEATEWHWRPSGRSQKVRHRRWHSPSVWSWRGPTTRRGLPPERLKTALGHRHQDRASSGVIGRARLQEVCIVGTTGTFRKGGRSSWNGFRALPTPLRGELVAFRHISNGSLSRRHGDELAVPMCLTCISDRRQDRGGVASTSWPFLAAVSLMSAPTTASNSIHISSCAEWSPCTGPWF